MECTNCEQTQRQFFCPKCLRSHVREFRLRILHFATERDAQVTKSVGALDFVKRNRSVRADIAAAQDRLEELANGLAKLRRDNDSKRERLRALRENLSTRQQTLASAKSIPGSLTQTLTREQHEHQSLSVILARARSGLVKELLEVYNVSEQTIPPPPLSNNSNASKVARYAQQQVPEWTIGDLVLPVPGDIRRYPPDHINAVITHTIHFLSLITFYLGVKLPFEVVWSGNKFGVGTPWIGAIRGGEAGGWAKWYNKHPLHLSATPAPAPSPLASSTSSAELISDSIDLLASHQLQQLPPPPPSIRSYSSPYHHPRPPRTSNASNPSSSSPNTQTSFSTALAMMIYNTTYLAHTQSLDIPLSQTGNILANLYAICLSPELGKKSHETRPYLLPPGVVPSGSSSSSGSGDKGAGAAEKVLLGGGGVAAGFSMEFTQVVQVVSVHPRAKPLGSAAKKGKALMDKEENGNVGTVEEEWDLMDEDFVS